MTAWIELRLDSTSALREVYKLADQTGALSIHHFNDEPWWPKKPAVRILLPDDCTPEILFAWFGECFSWDSTPDEMLYGDAWAAVMDLFEAVSRLSLLPNSGTVGKHRNTKLIHCALNTLGYDVPDEAAFAAKFVRNRWKIHRHFSREPRFRSALRFIYALARSQP